MNLLERAIATVSPRAALRRVQARLALSAINARYDGAKQSKTYKVSRDNTTGDVQVVRDAATCRAQARDFERNNDVFRGALHTLARNIVGPNGISIEPMPRNANDDINDTFARDLLNLWREFTASPEVTKTLDWVQTQYLGCCSWLRDGDLFGQIIQGPTTFYNYATRIPLAIELLEADHVPLEYSNGDNIEAGIERNAWNEPVAYYVYKTHPGSARAMLTDTALKRVPAQKMLHVAIRERLSGLRGISQFASVFVRLYDIKDYEDSERLAARISAAIAAYVKRDVNMEYSPPAGTDPDKRDFRLNAGAVFDKLMPGEELDMLNPSRPNTALNDFCSGQYKRASRGAQLTYSAISGDYNGTYSAQRQELVEGYDGYRMLTAIFVARFVRPIWEAFVSTSIAAGLVKVPADVRPETVAQAEFRGPKMPWIDPVREAQGQLTMVRAGFQSAQSVIADRGGRLQDTFEQLGRERRLADEIGLVLDSDARYVSDTGVAQSNAPKTDPSADTGAANSKVIPMPNRLNSLTAGVRAGLRNQHREQREHIEPSMQLKPSAAANEYELLIYGDIGESWFGESITALSIVQQLLALPVAVTTINVRINSYGGSVSDGLAIYNALKRHPATKAVTVDGVAMSSASLIAMAGSTIAMPATSLMMIHAPWGGIAGNAQEMREYAQILDTYAEAMADAYVAKSGKARADVLTLLQDGKDHYYTGEQAVAEGFADSLIDASSADAEPDENARAFAAGILHRYAVTLGSNAQLAVAAALRPPHTSQKRTVPAGERPGETVPANPILPADAGNQPPASAGNPTGAHVMPEATATPVAAPTRAEILAADRQRRDAIAAHFAPYARHNDLEIAKLQKTCEDDVECSAESAGLKLLKHLGSGAEPLNGGLRVEPGAQQEQATYREGAINALLNRANPSAVKLDDKGRQFVGFSLNDLARDCAERSGVRTRGMAKPEIAIKAMQSTSDFPNILENIITKSLRAGYAGGSRTFTSWARQGESLPDFKLVSRTQLAGAPALKRVVEGAEYEEGFMGDGAEKYAVQKYGRIVAITWETIVNDDLGAMTRIPQAFGASAADLESDLVYAIVNGNPNMADGKPLFGSDHKNLGTATALKATLDDTASLDPIAEMRELMLLQKGIEGRYITVRPKYLLVPPKLEQTALRICSAAFVAAKGLDINVLGALLTPVIEPRLHDESDTAYYGISDPATVDTIEYAYLQGNEGVFTETKNGFEIDGVQVKCRHVFGAKAIDWRGMVKNAGA